MTSASCYLEKRNKILVSKYLLNAGWRCNENSVYKEKTVGKPSSWEENEIRERGGKEQLKLFWKYVCRSLAI